MLCVGFALLSEQRRRGSAQSSCGWKFWPCLSCMEVAVFTSIGADMKAVLIAFCTNVAMPDFVSEKLFVKGGTT